MQANLTNHIINRAELSGLSQLCPGVLKGYPISYTQTFKLRYEIYTPREQFLILSKLLGSVLSESCNFWICAELTQNNRIHFHGCLEILPKKKTYFKTITKVKLNNIGRNETVQWRNEVNWIKYCFKEYKVMQEILGMDNIVVTHNNYMRDYAISIDTFFSNLVISDNQ